MKKVALIFVLAVLLPSLVLGWLAVRSLRDQQFLLERQQSLLCQRVTDTLAQNIAGQLLQWQQEFNAQVEGIVDGQNPRSVAAGFDNLIRQRWPLADVGFCVTLSGKILAPSPNDRSEAQAFYLDNRAFLGNREAAEVYWNATATKAGVQNSVQLAQNQSSADSLSRNSYGSWTRNQAASTEQRFNAPVTAQSQQQSALVAPGALKDSAEPSQPAMNSLNYKQAQTRKVSPQSQLYQIPSADKGQALNAADVADGNLSKAVPAEAEFSQLVGNDYDGMLARFLQNKLKLMFWHRINRAPDLVFGAELNLNRVVDGLRGFIQGQRDMRDEICLALLDDNARPVVLSQANFQANWKRPFVATEVGDALPHWEVAAYLVNPAQLTQAARIASLTLGLLITVLLLAIGVGSWLIVRSLNSELKLARQKTDFVSNVSHELKTPLTSIRMFSELLADGRVTDSGKQRSYLNIITAEAARLTRLINNVLDFSRMERGEKKYNFQSCDLGEVVRMTAETFRPHFQANGFKFECAVPEGKILVEGDCDALSQVIVNLLSNAGKYSIAPERRPPVRSVGDGDSGHAGAETSAPAKDISVSLAQKSSPLSHAEIRVMDRGPGVPRGSGEKIFEKFYRAHDSLSNGIQGSGLGLTIARQIARAHGGDLVYEPREGGGSCFILRLPVSNTDEHR